MPPNLRLRLLAAALTPILGFAALTLAPPAARAAGPDVATSADPDADAVVEAAPAGEDRELDSASQRSEYDHQHFVLLDGDGRLRVRRGTRTLSGVDLYVALGRDDLADRLRSRQRQRIFGGGVGVALLGVGLYLSRRDGRDCSGATRAMAESCRLAADEEHRTNLIYGVGSLALGAGILVTAILWTTPDPVSHAELDRIVAHANWKLRRRLGVVDVAALPSLAPDGAGLVLAGSF